MKRMFVWWLCCFGWLAWAGAQTVEEQYVRVYNLIQEADALRTSGDEPSALSKYLEAQTALRQIQKVYPSWNPKIVNFRVKYLGDRIAAIPQPRPVPLLEAANQPGSASVTNGNAAPSSAPTASGAASSDDSALKQQLAALQESVRQLQSEKTILEAKLKEALSTQPAAIDPRELAKAQERIQTLLKENELLKAGLEQEKKRVAPVEGETLIALRAENELLKQQLAEARTPPAPATAPASPVTAEAPQSDLARQLAAAEARIAALTSDAEVMRLEKVALETRLRAAQTAAPGPAAKSEIVSRGDAEPQIKELQRQRDELYKLLERRNAGGADNFRTRELTAQVNQLTREVNSLKSRVEVFEAKAIPYSPEELALLEQARPKPQPVPVVSTSAETKPPEERKSVRDIPAGTVALAAQAEKLFAAKQYDKAEENYLEILRQDENNAYTLANLAAIQMEMGRLAEAETNIVKALAIAPDDGHAASLLGYLKFRQEKYDEAIEALNRAAKLNPQDADIQNYLGVTLSHKGLRGPAEQAFRKAITINPAHAGAQNNLAVFYASENPPNVPLARFHYDRALKAGHPRNPEVEQLLEKKAALPKAGAAQ